MSASFVPDPRPLSGLGGFKRQVKLLAAGFGLAVAIAAVGAGATSLRFLDIFAVSVMLANGAFITHISVLSWRAERRRDAQGFGHPSGYWFPVGVMALYLTLLVSVLTSLGE